MTALWSIALRDTRAPDYADATIVSIAPGGSVDPAAWARRIFSLSDQPLWVRAVLGRTLRGEVAIREHSADEVMVAFDDPRLDIRCAVAIDEHTRLLCVTTTVRRRERRPLVPLALVHPVLLRAMLRAAARTWRYPAF
jgi:hypothetical protein